jgi:hypothetical protein
VIRVALLLAYLPAIAWADLGATATGGVRIVEHGGVAPAFTVGLEVPFGSVAPFAALDLTQAQRDSDAQGVPFSLVVREAALVAGITVQLGRPFAQAGLRLALQDIRSSTTLATQRDTGVGLGGAFALGWSWPQGFTLALELVVDPMASDLTGETWVVSAGPKLGYRWGASRR